MTPAAARPGPLSLDPAPHSVPPCEGRFQELSSVLRCCWRDCCCCWPACSPLCLGSFCRLLGSSVTGSTPFSNLRHTSSGRQSLGALGIVKGLFALANPRLTYGPAIRKLWLGRRQPDYPHHSRLSTSLKMRAELRDRRTTGSVRTNSKAAVPASHAMRWPPCVSVAARN